MQTDTSGGSRETQVKELAAMPTGAPPTIAQTATTPDGKQPNARRNSAASRRSTIIGSTARRPLTQPD